MSLDITINYWRETKDTKLIWEVKESWFESVDIPYNNNVIIVINETKEWVSLISSWPQSLATWKFDHVRTWNYSGTAGTTQRKMWETISKTDITFLKYNWELLFIALHKAVNQCDMWTDYIIQILKKIEENNKNIEELTWTYEGQYTRFSNIEMRNNWWRLIIDDETLNRFVKYKEVEWVNWLSSANIIRV